MSAKATATTDVTPSWKKDDPVLKVPKEWPDLPDVARPFIGLGCCALSLVLKDCRMGNHFKCNVCCVVHDCHLCTSEHMFYCNPHIASRTGFLDIWGLSTQFFCCDTRWSLCFGNSMMPCIFSFLGCTCCLDNQYVGCNTEEKCRGFFMRMEELRSLVPKPQAK